MRPAPASPPTLPAMLLATTLAASALGQTIELEIFVDGVTGPTVTYGDSSDDHLGMCIISAERDFDGDGFDDTFAGAPLFGSGDHGKVWVVSGRSSREICSFESPGGAMDDANHYFGFSLATLDVDGDGTLELAVGAPGPGTMMFPGERIYVYQIDSAGCPMGTPVEFSPPPVPNGDGAPSASPWPPAT